MRWKIFRVIIKSLASGVVGWFLWFSINQYGPTWICPIDYQNSSGAVPQHVLVRYSVGLPFPVGCNPSFYGVMLEIIDFIVWVAVTYLLIGFVEKLFKRKP